MSQTEWHEFGRHASERPASPAAWRETGVRLGRLRTRLEGTGSRQLWEVGDRITAEENVAFKNLTRSTIRRMAAEITEDSRYALGMAASRSRRVGPAARVERLASSHHQVVAAPDRGEHAGWLTAAAEQGWSVSEMSRHRCAAGSTGGRMREGRCDRLVGGGAPAPNQGAHRCRPRSRDLWEDGSCG